MQSDRLRLACGECGHSARVPASFAGRKVRCAKCNAVIRVGGEKKPPEERPARAAAPKAEPAPAPPPVVGAAPTLPLRKVSRLYWVLALAFVPLALMSLGDQTKRSNDFVKRFQSTIATAAPKTAHLVEGMVRAHATIDQVLDAIPEHRIDGAYLARDSRAHYLFAAESALLFVVVLSVLFPWASTRDGGLLLVSVFTGTFGILFLFLVQSLFASAYAYADDPDASIFTSMFGYTTGVGLCEELAKALPLVIVFLTGRSMDWRRACLWGFASGVGFGVSEGIQYSGEMYNGLARGDIYVVRFVSCVALHALWAASSAIVLSERQSDLRKVKSLDALRWTLLRALAAPMLLHGFYDTLLKHDQHALALVTALGSFAWFASEVERLEEVERTGYASAPAARAPRLAAA